MRRGVSPLVSSIIIAGAMIAVGIVLLAYAEMRLNDAKRSLEALRYRLDETLTVVYTYISKQGDRCNLTLILAGKSNITIVYLGREAVMINNTHPINVLGFVKVDIPLDTSICNNDNSVKIGTPVLLITSTDRVIGTEVMKVIRK